MPQAATDGLRDDNGSPQGATPLPPSELDLAKVMLHMPVGIRSLSLVIVAVLASLFALQWAKDILIPILFGLVLSYALTPVVDRLTRWRVPRAAGAGLVVTAIIAGVCWVGWSMQDEASAFIESLPVISQKLRQIMQSPGAKPSSTIAKVQQAAAEIAKAAGEGSAGGASAPPGGAPLARLEDRFGSAKTTTTAQPSQPVPTRVVIEQSGLNLTGYLWTGTLGLASFLGQTAIVLLVTFFLLATGNSFRRKMVKLAGPKLSQKKLTIEALDEVTGQIQRYLLVQIATSVIVGAATGLAFFALGLNHAAVWGVVAGVTNLIPYVGALIVGAGSTIVGLLQFGDVQTALLVGVSSFAIHAVVGNLLTPWLTGRASRMSPFAVFVGVLAFGWLWGPVGLILGVPILMAIKTVCDRVEELKPVGEFLGA